MSHESGQKPLQGTPQPGLAYQGEHDEKQRDCQGSDNDGCVAQCDLLSRMDENETASGLTASLRIIWRMVARLHLLSPTFV